MFQGVFKNRKVLVTGHTGFKGSWLTLWLKRLGAQVGGASLNVPTNPSHYELINLKSQLGFEALQDIRDLAGLKKAFDEFQPEILFHIAAEAIVTTCFDSPKLAFDTNLGGTVNILECVRSSNSLRSAVIITSDKCYENFEWDYGYRETDRLGGKDPYSASKACAELAISAYFRSYLVHNERLRIATARAGNVIGGGDWAKDRIVCDCIRALSDGKQALIRNPHATRPWQLVLEPLTGYLHLASTLWSQATGKIGRTTEINGESFNFGPRSEVEATVENLLTSIHARWPKFSWKTYSKHAIQGTEASLLKLNCDKALRRLDWKPTLTFDETIGFLTDWYRCWFEGEKDLLHLSIGQLKKYEQLAKERNQPWTV